ncbi:serine/threonine-protein phosphatase 6 regulatory ankyrin repeat subunit A-like [Lineus longissimus]|uniref:serine/threonine-protein phosphatase 6 regulatory ankyrin repeat subunit A-like n=1 Tax=Lineus longissimus TaxID=88925 RepID=UPI00315DDC0E
MAGEIPEQDTSYSKEDVAKFGSYFRMYQFPVPLSTSVDLINACERGDVAQVLALLVRGADINARCLRYTRKPIHVAVEKGHKKVVELLIKQGALKDVCNLDGSTPLLIACQTADAGIVEMLVEQNARVNAMNKFNDRPIHLICNSGRLQGFVEKFIKRGAEVNVPDRSDSPLHISARRGYSGAADVLLKHGAKVDAVNTSGKTALHEACGRGHTSTVHALIEKGAYVTMLTDNKDKATPFYLACSSGNAKVARALIEKGVDINQCVSSGASPLDNAYKSQNKDIVEILVEKEASINQAKMTSLHIVCLLGQMENLEHYLSDEPAQFELLDGEGKTPLHIVTSQGYTEMAIKIVEAGADVNAKDNDEISCLHFAFRGHHLDIVNLLLDNGAYADIKSKNGTPLDLACEEGDVEIVEKMLRLTKERSENGLPRELLKPALERSCSNGHVNVLRLLLKHGAVIEDADAVGLVFAAAEGGHTNMLHALSSHGVKINVKDNNGNTPFHKACWSSDEAFLNKLKQFEVDVDAKNTDGQAVLHLASQHGQAQSVTALLKLGAKVDVQDNKMKTPLHIACANGREQVFKVLLENNATQSLSDESGWSPIHFAAESGSLIVIRTLLRSGSNVNERNGEGVTPIQLACLKGHFYAVCSLIEHGADVNHVDDLGRTALHVICERLFESPYVRRYVKFTDVPCDRTYVEIIEILIAAGCNVMIKDVNDITALGIIIRRLRGLPEGGACSRALFDDEVSVGLLGIFLDSAYDNDVNSVAVLSELYAKIGRQLLQKIVMSGCGSVKRADKVLLKRIIVENDNHMFRLLVETGYRIEEETLMAIAGELEGVGKPVDANFLASAFLSVKEPMTLKNACRIYIRHCLRHKPGRLSSHVECLPIPVSLKDTLAFDSC